MDDSRHRFNHHDGDHERYEFSASNPQQSDPSSGLSLNGRTVPHTDLLVQI